MSPTTYQCILGTSCADNFIADASQMTEYNPPESNVRDVRDSLVQQGSRLRGVWSARLGWDNCAVAGCLDEYVHLASRVTHSGSAFAFRKRWGKIDWRSLGEYMTTL